MADYLTDSIDRAQSTYVQILDVDNRVEEPMNVAKLSAQHENVLCLYEVLELLEALRSTLISINTAVTETAVNTRLLTQILSTVNEINGKIS